MILEGYIHNYVSLHFNACVITSVALHVHGGGLLDVEHVWVEEADVAYTFAGNVEPFVYISLDKHVQRLKIDFV